MTDERGPGDLLLPEMVALKENMNMLPLIRLQLLVGLHSPSRYVTYLRRLEGIVVGELYVQEVDTSRIWRTCMTREGLKYRLANRETPAAVNSTCTHSVAKPLLMTTKALLTTQAASLLSPGEFVLRNLGKIKESSNLRFVIGIKGQQDISIYRQGEQRRQCTWGNTHQKVP